MDFIAKKFKLHLIEARFTSLIVSVTVLLLRFFLFIQKGIPDHAITDTGFVWKYIGPYFANPYISFAASTASVFLIAAFISQLNLRYGLIRTRTSLPYIFPLIVFSVHPFFLVMTPDYVSTIFILWAFFPLLDSHQLSESHKFAFRSSILIAIAGIFQIYALLFIPLWWIGQYRMGGFNFRSLIASPWGVILVYWIVFALYVFGDNLQGFIEPFTSFAKFDFYQLPTFSLPQWGFVVSVLLLAIIYVTTDAKFVRRDKVIAQKAIVFVVTLMFFSIGFQIIYWQHTLFWLYIVLVLLSFIMAHFYTITAIKWEIYSFFILLFILLAFYLINYFTDSSPF